MHSFDPAKTPTLGADLRALRKSRGVTLSDLSEELGRSVGWLSQVERDKSEPSITDLRYIAAALDVPISMLFWTVRGPRLRRRGILCAPAPVVRSVQGRVG